MVGFEFIQQGEQFWVSVNLPPKVFYLPQNLQVVPQILNEGIRKFRALVPFRFAFVNQTLNRLVVIVFQQFENLVDMLLADVHISLLKLGDEHFVRVDKPVNRVFKSKETALQSFNQQDFHEFAHIALGLLFQLVECFFGIQQRRVTGISKFLGDELDSGIEYLIFHRVEFIEQRLRIGDLGEFQSLRAQILGEVFDNLRPGPAHHEIFKNLLANLAGISSHDA